MLELFWTLCKRLCVKHVQVKILISSFDFILLIHCRMRVYIDFKALFDMSENTEGRNFGGMK